MADQAAWARLGELLVRRRVAIDPRYRNRRTFCAETGQEYRTVFDLEKGRRDNYAPETLALVEIAYAWTHGSIQAVLAGGDPILVERAAAKPPASEPAAGQGPKPATPRLPLDPGYTEADFYADLRAGVEPPYPPGGFESIDDWKIWEINEDKVYLWEAIRALRRAKADHMARWHEERRQQHRNNA